jgi:hypothetical protein
MRHDTAPSAPSSYRFPPETNVTTPPSVGPCQAQSVGRGVAVVGAPVLGDADVGGAVVDDPVDDGSLDEDVVGDDGPGVVMGARAEVVGELDGDVLLHAPMTSRAATSLVRRERRPARQPGRRPFGTRPRLRVRIVKPPCPAAETRRWLRHGSPLTRPGAALATSSISAGRARRRRR